MLETRRPRVLFDRPSHSMLRHLSTYLSLAVLLLLVAAGVASAQPSQTPENEQPAGDTTRGGAPIVPEDNGVDTLGRSGADSLRVSTTTSSGADTVITYSSRDSMKLSIGGKLMRLFGDAEVTKGSMHLTAGYIEIDFNKSELYARAVYDSATKQYVGIPIFKDATQEFSALSMRYNFKTGKGITEAAETKFDDGFYYGERIKRVDDNTLFIQDGVYTTCDAPHPHYFFRSERMKVVVNDKIYVDQPTLYIADVPIFFIPIGVFFARSGGKQSGIIIPTWTQNTARGFAIEGLGYFWAGNEYIDAKFLANLYSKGGYSFNNVTRFRHRDFGVDQADVDYTFGRTRDDPDQELETSHHIRYAHSQKLGRRSQLGGSLDISTRNAIRRTSTSTEGGFDRTQDITTQLLRSNFSYSTGFDWGSFAAVYDRTQDIITDELTQRVPLSLQLTSWTPFSRVGRDQGVFDNLSLSGSVRATWEQVRDDTLPGGGFHVNDVRRGVQMSPSINLPLPKLGYFNVSPRVDAQSSIFFRRTFKEYGADSILVTRTEPQTTATLTYGAGLDFSTTLYGIVQPRVLGINALRHVLKPTISLTYRPDFGAPRYGYWDSTLNPRTGRFDRYSVFEADASVATPPGTGLTQAISVRLENTFEAKIAQGDTLEDARVRLLTLNASGSYNAAATEFKWSEVRLDANTQLGSVGSLSADLVLDPYAVDSAGSRINELLVNRGEGLARVRSGGVRFGLSFSDQGFGSTVAANPPIDSVASRRQRFDFEPIPFEEEQFFGDEVRGAGDYLIPWTVNIDGTYSVARSSVTEFTNYASLSVGFQLALTPTTRISSSVSYDIIGKEIAIPEISFLKDLHCWELQFNWHPSGYGSGFYFRLGLKAPQLRDIELEREKRFYR
jgi:hypothetical protein